MITGIKWTE